MADEFDAFPDADEFADFPDAEENGATAKSRAEAGRPGFFANALPTAIAGGLTANFNDEIAAGLETGFGLFGDYEEALTRVRGEINLMRQEFPWLFQAAEIGGALTLGGGLARAGATLVGRGGNLLSNAGRGMVEGTAYGAAFGAGAGEGAEDRVQDAMSGAALGGVAGGVLSGIGHGISKLRGARQPDTINAAREAVEQADQFDIPLSRGQATGDIRQQAFEQSAAADALGSNVGRRARDFFDRQRQAVTEAGEGVATDVGGGRRLVESAQDASDVVGDALRQRATGLRSAADDAFAAAERGNASIHVDAVQGLQQRVVDALADEIVPDNFGTLRGVIDRVNRLANREGFPEGAVGVHWREIERVRRTITAQRGGTPDEGRLLGKVRQTYDEWFQDAIDNALFEGDAATLDSLKEARGLWSRYMALTAKRMGDPSSRILNAITKGDASANETANALFGVSRIGARGVSVQLAKRLRNELGVDSEAMNAVRQASVIKLMERTRGTGQKGYQALATEIDEFLSRSGKQWSEIVFTPDQIKRMREFSNVVRALPPDARITNPSGSAHTAARLARSSMQALLTAFGFSAGGATGAVVGSSLPLIGGAANRVGIQRALTRPVPPAASRRGGRAGSGAIGAEIGDDQTLIPSP